VADEVEYKIQQPLRRLLTPSCTQSTKCLWNALGMQLLFLFFVAISLCLFRRSLRIFFSMIGSVFYFIITIKNFEGLSPLKKFYGTKTCNIWRDFGRLQTSAANISGTNEDIRNRTSTWSTAIPLAFAEKSPVNFGQVTMDICFLPPVLRDRSADCRDIFWTVVGNMLTFEN